MRMVKPKSIPNVDNDRLVDTIMQIDARLRDDDQPRGVLVRFAARRALCLFALADRGVDVDTGTASRTACAALWGVDPHTFRQVGPAK